MPDPSELPDPTQVEGAAHPRMAETLHGHAAAEAAVVEAISSGRLHSGWLITGPAGIGKATFAYRMAATLLSGEDPAGGLFGEAPALGLPVSHPDARLIRSSAHPRLALVQRRPNDKGDRLSAEIRAADVRRLKDFFHLSATDGGRRVVIVDAADEMNVTAANAVLKELEEPPARTTLLLISHQPARLLPTIRSRCRLLRLEPLGAEDLSAVLAEQGIQTDAPEALAVLAGGSAGRAIRLTSDGGLQLYAEIVRLFEGLPGFDRAAAIAFAEKVGARGAEGRFDLALGLLDLFLSRAARAGLVGEPDSQGAPGEARLLARLSPHDRAARSWAELGQHLSARARAAKAVNLDPPSLILDMLFRIEEAARRAA
ncbi:DNA polymerase III subunit delta' [Pseudoroseicyclus tamaricis]|uniref:DNA polymerase III subunit delta n=1 Tax=Pseudoroseicyclus tamaricis TaxID=2705421 RepID=A0A6B2JZC9_9RHOB|nr:DNA polymerase III subunit delta' [Pseudoroseicyclus tamaricis]NDV01999.1 DNA polymerase III subunit delta' [Pseudoroseicyclus tamaricis]